MPDSVAGVGRGTILPEDGGSEINSEAEFEKAAEELIFTLIMVDMVLEFVSDNE
jgi:hypothetical protein